MVDRREDTIRHYPARYFSAAPTYFVWNPLTARAIHDELKTASGFEGQDLYFILNHPIKFVRLAGLIVDTQLLGNGKYLLLCLDDGSGCTIECKVEVRQLPRQDDATRADRVMEEWPSTTRVDNLDVYVYLGTPTIEIDKRPVDIGTVVKVKGTVDTFRQQRQLKLERVRIVEDTNEEAKAWQETAEWQRNTLSKPWVLTNKQRLDIDAKLTEERAQEAEKLEKHRRKDAKYLEKRRHHEEKKEKRRQHVASLFDSGALLRSNLLPEHVTDS